MLFMSETVSQCKISLLKWINLINCETIYRLCSPEVIIALNIVTIIFFYRPNDMHFNFYDGFCFHLIITRNYPLARRFSILKCYSQLTKWWHQLDAIFIPVLFLMFDGFRAHEKRIVSMKYVGGQNYSNVCEYILFASYCLGLEWIIRPMNT